MRGMTITMLVAALAILGCGIYTGMSSQEASQRFAGQVLEVEQRLLLGDWDAALSRLNDIIERWEQQGETLQMWVNHADVDDVTLGLEQLKISIISRELYHARLYTAELNEALSHIYHRDAFRLKNIL